VDTDPGPVTFVYRGVRPLAAGSAWTGMPRLRSFRCGCSAPGDRDSRGLPVATAVVAGHHSPDRNRAGSSPGLLRLDRRAAIARRVHAGAWWLVGLRLRVERKVHSAFSPSRAPRHHTLTVGRVLHQHSGYHGFFDFDRAINTKPESRAAVCGCSGIVSGGPSCLDCGTRSRPV
jgi:hypothetical protein